MNQAREWLKKGVRINAWLHPESLLALPERPRKGRSANKQYPAQARIRNGEINVRAQATRSLTSSPRGSRRAYLERADAEPVVLQQAPIETWPERWSIWIRPSEAMVNTDVIARVLTAELGTRFGVSPEDVYVVEHGSARTDGGWHLHVHAVVPAQPGMDLTREVMASIGREIVRELVLERQLNKAMELER
jgi:hypothetical protein